MAGFFWDHFLAEGFLGRGAANLYKRNYAMAAADYSSAWSDTSEAGYIRSYNIQGAGYRTTNWSQVPKENTFKQQLAKNPGDVDILYQQATFHMEYGLWNDAIQEYKNVLKIKPDGQLDGFVQKFEKLLNTEEAPDNGGLQFPPTPDYNKPTATPAS